MVGVALYEIFRSLHKWRHKVPPYRLFRLVEIPSKNRIGIRRFSNELAHGLWRSAGGERGYGIPTIDSYLWRNLWRNQHTQDNGGIVFRNKHFDVIFDVIYTQKITEAQCIETSILVKIKIRFRQHTVKLIFMKYTF